MLVCLSGSWGCVILCHLCQLCSTHLPVSAFSAANIFLPSLVTASTSATRFSKSFLSLLFRTALNFQRLPLSWIRTAAFWLLVCAASSSIPNFPISSTKSFSLGSSMAIAFYLVCPLCFRSSIFFGISWISNVVSVLTGLLSLPTIDHPSLMS